MVCDNYTVCKHESKV